MLKTIAIIVIVLIAALLGYAATRDLDREFKGVLLTRLMGESEES